MASRQLGLRIQSARLLEGQIDEVVTDHVVPVGRAKGPHTFPVPLDCFVYDVPVGQVGEVPYESIRPSIFTESSSKPSKLDLSAPVRGLR